MVSIYLFIYFRFGALYIGLIQFNCSLFHFQASFPKVLLPNCIVHWERVTVCFSGEGQRIYWTSHLRTKIHVHSHYGYITVTSVHIFKEFILSVNLCKKALYIYMYNIHLDEYFYANWIERGKTKNSQLLNLLSLLVHFRNSENTAEMI